MRTVITADRLWNGGQILDRPAIVIEDGLIVSIASAASDGAPCGVQTFRYPGATLAPAYFDVHFHGSSGHDVMEATPEALGTIGRFLARHGVGSYLATTVTAPIDETLRSLSGLAKWIGSMPGDDGPADEVRDEVRDQARMIGIHFEGPFLSHLRRGVHPPDLLLAPDIGVFDRMFEAAEGHVRLMTLAPELPGAIELAQRAIAKGVRVSVGHSNATAPETRAAIAAGAVSATHTYNAMRPLDHRDPGILGTVLSTDSLYAELICDGIHTMPEVVRIWWRSKGPERAILITDAMSAAGMPDGMYRLGNMMVQVKDGRASAGDALAGSLLTLNRGLSNCIEFTGAPLDQALRLVTTNPAAMTGLGDRIDTLAAGHAANMVAVDSAGKLIASIRGGQSITE
jgi:N-acetylglucosamine-6-phosphate deacetylase